MRLINSSESQIAIIKTHTLSTHTHGVWLHSCWKNGDGAVKGSQMGQISEVRRSLVDIWKKIAGMVCNLHCLSLRAVPQHGMYGRYKWKTVLGCEDMRSNLLLQRSNMARIVGHGADNR